MSRLFYLMGKSACGKDSIYMRLLEELKLDRFLLYTTRPMRSGEAEGVEYHFTDMDAFRKLKDAGKVIEYRDYNTVLGHWIYYTVDEGLLGSAGGRDLLGIGTLESYEQLVKYYGQEQIVPVYIEVENGLRLERAISRERKQEKPQYSELCRRFLADEQDFSEEKIAEAGIERRFVNDDFDRCLAEIKAFIQEKL